MNEEQFTPMRYKHYIEINLEGNITFGWSDGPTTWKEITDNDICITEDGDYQFCLFPGGEPNPPLSNMMGVPLYHYNQITGEITKRSDEEIADAVANLPPPPPTRLEQLEANVAFIAAMTDTDLDT